MIFLIESITPCSCFIEIRLLGSVLFGEHVSNCIDNGKSAAIEPRRLRYFSIETDILHRPEIFDLTLCIFDF